MNGDDSDVPREQVLFLARAESRVRIMDALAEAESVTNRQLRDRLDASRTTVSRALRSLAERGWVEKSDGAYRLTRAGQHVATAFDRLLDTVDRVDELAEFLRWFPSDVESPDFLAASDVTVTYSTDADPYAPARKQTGILHTAGRLRILLPAIDRESTGTLVEQVTEHGLDVETVVPPAVESTMESDEFAPLMRKTVQTGRSSVWVADEDVPFYLGIPDEGAVQVGLADGDGLPRALLETTDDRVRTWAERLYAEFRNRADPKPADEF
ncbi:helix-turn-helix transcriptional regulator [Halorarius halobius]|uniref:helix-turn-helix transcriptional regulator n=1 Tax=Halorarius halobius TaxID=2962671 RepID=UPI0020CD1ECE|nr:helix-turn-helix domain-containing protein [Halorarius halobius]